MPHTCLAKTPGCCWAALCYISFLPCNPQPCVACSLWLDACRHCRWHKSTFTQEPSVIPSVYMRYRLLLHAMSTAALEASKILDQNFLGCIQSLHNGLSSNHVEATASDPNRGWPCFVLCWGHLLLVCSVPQLCAMLVQSFFSWHVEDVDLLSINYLHYGASKVQHFLNHVLYCLVGPPRCRCHEPITATVLC